MLSDPNSFKRTFDWARRRTNPGQNSLGQYCNIHIFLSFLDSLLKQYILFEIFSKFSLPPPYTKLKLGKNSGYTRLTLFVGWGEGLDLGELEKAPETQKCPKTFVHDCRPKENTKKQCWTGRYSRWGEGGEGRWEETKFMAQNITLMRNVKTCEAKWNIKS